MAEVLTVTEDTNRNHEGATSRRTDSTRQSAIAQSSLSNGIASAAPPEIHADGDEEKHDESHQSFSLTAVIEANGAKSHAASPEDLNGSSESPIDPLSQHILKRTQTERSIPLKLRSSQTSHAQDSSGDGNKPSPTEQAISRTDAVGGVKPSKEKKKGGSFLSRFIGTKKAQTGETPDNVSESLTGEPNGMDDIFAHPIGFIPRFPPPPKYIKVKAHYKKHKVFDKVFLAQELKGSEEDGDDAKDKSNKKAIWSMVFSKDGKYLAAAGQDKIVRVWAVITNVEARAAHEQEEEETKGDARWRLTAPVFKSKPIREYKGHTGSVLDLSWSKNNFLLSSSMDRTVRLWHVSRAECLCCFKHSDFVTSIQFHPRDDRFFLAGSLDSKLRLWSIPDKSVAFWATVRDMITAVAFTPDGKYSIAGCLNGLCILYETDGLKANAQVHVRSARGKNAKGSKITGIDTIFHPPNDPNGEVKLLITSNDSRIRLYNFKNRILEAKYRGNENSTSQIRASFSDDGKFIICGSEDRRTYIWPTGSVDREPDKRAVEELETRTSIVTSAVMAPTTTKQLLGFAGDPLYDLCNPPPITLGNTPNSNRSSVYSSNKAPQQPGELDQKASDQKASDQKARGSPAYLARSTHPDGNIILAADYSGRIKVFRQDCAYKKRPSDWDAGSTLSKKILGRSNSARHSIASSKSPSEKILAWRSSVTGTELASISSPSSMARSISPRKSLNQQRYSSPGRSVTTKTQSGTATPRTYSVDNVSESNNNNNNNSSTHKPQPTTETRNLQNLPHFAESGQSYAFWTKSADFVKSANAKQQQNLLSPNSAGIDDISARRKSSVPSALSSDMESFVSEDDDDQRDDDDEVEGEGGSRSTGDQGEDVDDVLRCPRCGGKNFRATKMRMGKPKLVCVKCNTAV